MITETLVSDSALKKLYYYPVCRCQRTGRAHVGSTGEFDVMEFLPSHQLKTVVIASGSSLSTFPPSLSPSTPHTLTPALSMVGVAGFEPATLRLSSACSNQLSYTPEKRVDS